MEDENPLFERRHDPDQVDEEFKENYLEELTVDEWEIGYLTEFLSTDYSPHYELATETLLDIAKDIGETDNSWMWSFEEEYDKIFSDFSAEDIESILKAKARENFNRSLDEIGLPTPKNCKDYTTGLSNFLSKLKEITEDEVVETEHDGHYDFTDFNKKHYHSLIKAVKEENSS